MAKQLTATQVFLRALKETGEYNHVMKVVRDKNKRSDHIGYNWKPNNIDSRTFVENLMREMNCNLLFVIEYISLGLQYEQFMETTKKIHKWIMKNVKGNYLKRLLKHEIPEFYNGSRRGYHEIEFSWRD